MTDDSATLRITVNDTAHELRAPATVLTLLAHLDLDPQQAAVERNKDLVRRADHGATTVEDGDVFEVVTFLGGG